MFHCIYPVSLVGGPLDGGQEQVTGVPGELEICFDPARALIEESYHSHVHPLVDPEYYEDFTKQVRAQFAARKDRGIQVLLYHRGADGRYHFVKQRGLEP